MKRILCVVLAVLMLCSVCLMTGCEAKTLKLGMGVVAAYGSQTDADGETNGSAEAVITAAAVLLDKDGKIVKCVLDVADNKVDYTSAGKAVANDSFKTKYELGDDYGMKNPDYGSAKEWYEHAVAFVAACIGKKAGEITTDLQVAGCTIAIDGFVKAAAKVG